ncbi:AbrB/MazE/SpoVT family DNA-binding domain-containing protein [Pseudomonas fluorescens]|nr:AbrB/MazE/SpoVT family DNA-binding domain-containing protein [Pseudomonas fluorescens]
MKNPWTVDLQGFQDASADAIIDVPPDVLKAVNVGLGDSLSIERVDESIVLNPVSEVDAKT